MGDRGFFVGLCLESDIMYIEDTRIGLHAGKIYNHQ